MDQPIEANLVTWWQELLCAPAVSLDDDFFDLGGDSIVATRLFNSIKRAYGVNLVLSTLFDARTIRQLADTIRTAQASSDIDRPVPAVVRLQEAHSTSPLFVISGLGGNVLNFKELARHFGDGYPLYALQPRGLDGKEPYHTRVEDTAAYYAAEVQKVQPAGPYFLAGYSFGGLIALEVAQQLAAKGEPIGFLGLLDTIEYRYQLQVKDGLSTRERMSLFASQLRAAVFGKGQWGYLSKRLETKLYMVARRVLAGIGIDAPLWGSISDINSYAAFLYRPRIYGGAVSIFRTAERELLDGDDEFLGWRDLIAGPITVVSVPGNHFTMTREPNVSVLAKQLRDSIEKAHASVGSDSFPQHDALTLQMNGR